MSLDELARTSTVALLEATAARTDTFAGRAALSRRVRRWWRIRALLAALGALLIGSVAVGIGAAVSTSPAAPHHSAMIIVHRGAGLYAVDPNTGASRRLPSWPGFVSGGDGLAVSPDGTQIAYESSAGLQISDLTSKDTQSLSAPPGWQAAIRWTADGITVARFDYHSRPVDLVVTQVINGQITSQHTYQPALPDVDPGANMLPSFSPDGSQLAFSAMGKDNIRHLYVMDADGTNVRELGLNTDSGVVVQVAWSHDGTQIAYTDWPGGHGAQTHLFLINADGSNRTDLGTIGNGIEDKDVGAAIACSPDNTSIAFLGKNLKRPGWALYIKDLNGTTRRLPITNPTGFTITWAAGS